MKAVLGIDGGGTKTEGIVLSLDGKLLGFSRVGGSNFQGTGLVKAEQVIKSAIDSCIQNAGNPDIIAAGYGLAGVDRQTDYDRIHEFIRRINPDNCRFTLVNDVNNTLRAGSANNCGIAIISGTGVNAMGINEDGQSWRVCGYGYEFGDYGSGGDIALAGLRAASRYLQERGPKTIIGDIICKEFGLDDIHDIMEFWYEDSKPHKIKEKDLAPYVFKAASLGDMVAINILIEVAKDFYQSVKIIAGHIFHKDDSFKLIFGGSVFQKGESPVLVQSIIDFVKSDYLKVSPVLLDVPPVIGAALLGMDITDKKGMDVSESLRKAVIQKQNELINI